MREAFEQWFGELLAVTLRTKKPLLFFPAVAGWPSAVEAGWEDAWENATSALLDQAGPDFHVHCSLRGAALGRALDAQSAQLNAQTFHDCVTDRLQIQSRTHFECDPDRDFWYFKINHGYWEQLFRIFGTYDASKMRVPDAAPFRHAYVDSGFTFVLEALMLRLARVQARRVSFPDVYFGFSLQAGSESHETLLEGFPSRPVMAQRIPLGAAIGLFAVFGSVFGDCRITLEDGSFPKRAAMAGTLRETLLGFARHADRILFVVPPHLQGVTLTGVDTPQETLVLPGTRVHECWAAALWSVGREIFQRLETDERVMVITQSAVFAAMLGLFLRAAKHALGLEHRRIFFLDLGQVLDSAAPTRGGPWITRYEVGDPSLFCIPNSEDVARHVSG